MNQNPNHVYLNLLIPNDSASNIEAFSTVTRDGNIIDRPREWLLSIDRFFINYMFVPVWKPKLNGTDTGITFSMTYAPTGNTYSANVLVAPGETEFYSIQPVVDHFNECLNTIIGALNAAEGTALNAPEFSFASDLWSIISDMGFLADCDLHVNQRGHLLMNTFQFSSINPNSQQFATFLLNGNDRQQKGTVDLWSPVKKIVVKTTLPLTNEMIPTRNQTSNVERGSEAILTDFVLYPETATPILQVDFSSQGNHRWQSMQDCDDMSQFNVQFYWTDDQSRQYPVMLGPDGQIEVKLVFKHIDSSF